MNHSKPRQLLSIAPAVAPGISGTAASPYQVTLGGTGLHSLSFVDVDGTTDTVTLAGPGSANVGILGNDLTTTVGKRRQAVAGVGITVNSVATSGTTLRSALLFGSLPDGKSRPATVSIGDIIVTGGSIGSIIGNIDVTGSISVEKAVGKISIDDFTPVIPPPPTTETPSDGGASPAPTGTPSTTAAERVETLETATLGRSKTALRHSVGPAKAITVPVADSSGTTIVAGSVGSLRVRDNCGPLDIGGTVGSISVGKAFSGGYVGDGIDSIAAGTASSGLTTSAIGKMRVAGDMSTFELTLSGQSQEDLGSLVVAGKMYGCQILSAGSIGLVSAAAFDQDEILAGISVAQGVVVPTMLPSSLADFPNQASIGSVCAAMTFNTNIVAHTVKSVALGALTPANGGVPFGIAAKTVESVAGSNAGKRFQLTRLADAATAIADLTAAGLTGPGVDFTVRLI